MRSNSEILRSIALQVGCYIDFVKKSLVSEDQYLHPYKPKGSKFLILEEVAQHWATDEYFARELFNGCNPLSV
jgi:hypothetical protein